MAKEDKQLLLKDLCARLPYGVKCQTKNGIGTLISVEYSFGENLVYIDLGHPEAEEYDLNDGDTVKPYLRPMSSMTEEEENEYNSLNAYEGGIFPHTEEAFDWLNAHHFDFRNLIERGLAIETTENNKPYEKII